MVSSMLPGDVFDVFVIPVLDDRPFMDLTAVAAIIVTSYRC